MIARRSFGRFATAMGLLMGLACVPPRGGWDLEVLMAAQPGIAALDEQRLGDMLPFPALDGDRIALVACRFAEAQRVLVRGDGPPSLVAWTRSAVRALDGSVASIGLVLEFDEEGGSIARSSAQIEIVIVDAIAGEGPAGLGDTLCECDVSETNLPTPDAIRTYRGLLAGAEIRMRRVQVAMTGRMREASAEEWVGALMHELAHALGFSGHAATGSSILMRDETRIRAAGRRALMGDPMSDSTLDALYQLRPGQRLGTRDVRADDLKWLRAIEQVNRKRSVDGRSIVGTYASVGDREARIVWRYSDGSQLGLRFPSWRSELRSGVAISLRPDHATQRVIEAAAVRFD